MPPFVNEVNMRILIVTMIAMLVMTTIVPAQDADKLIVKCGRQKASGKTGLTIKFVSVVEDSRCPEGVNCIWAGNAKIKVKISDKRGSKEAEMNTTVGPLGDQYGGYAIRLVSLKPLPTQKGRPSPGTYRAEFSIERLTR